MYAKRLKRDGTVMKNKYKMEMIDCCRETNRTEAYHKQLVKFGTWHTGVEMSDCLLAERRHRHNNNVSEKRRFGFPILGNYDTWKWDKLQTLYMENHGTVFLPYWSNASDYKTTGESFDTIALYCEELQKALEDRCKELGSIKQSQQSKYISEMMCTPVPLLPFCGNEEENKCFSKYVCEHYGLINDERTAVDWCRCVDGVNIHAKSAFHIRSARIQQTKQAYQRE